MTLEIGFALSVLVVTIILFVTEALRVDIVGMLIMISVVWLGLLEPSEALSGLSSNAVVAIISVMILGYGIDQSGTLSKLIQPIIRAAGSDVRRLISLVCLSIGILSAFMQNIGAVALFLPALLRISKRTKISASRLLMPMGFSALMGGTISMVGSSSLIMLNDLIKQGGQEMFGLFTVAPIGLALLTAGILYFFFLGKYVLPGTDGEKSINPQQELIGAWKLPTTVYRCTYSDDSSLVDKTFEDIQLRKEYNLNYLAIMVKDDILYAPWRQIDFAVGRELALLGKQSDIERFVSDYDLKLENDICQFKDVLSSEDAGFAEIMIPPRAPIAGKTMLEIDIRKYKVEPIMLLRGAKEERGNFYDMALQPGDTIIAYGLYKNIKAMEDRHNFVVITPIDAKAEKTKPITALLCFVGAIGMAFAGLPLSISFLTGALAMILLRVVKIDEAYRAVNWRTVFLLAGLIPLGLTMDKTGAAEYIADLMMGFLQGTHPILILFAVAALATIFSLFMSNVGATILLVPLVMIIGEQTGINPRMLALLVGVCTANSFVLPTHHINALLMSPGGYHNADYIKPGTIMTLIFMSIVVGIIYFFYI